MSLAAPRQLTLDFGQPASFAHEDFIAGAGNAAARELIESWPHWPDRAAAVIGPEGVGKSHLAAVWAARARAHVVLAEGLREADLSALAGEGAVVIDGLDPESVDQPVLFHLLNLAREHATWLLLTARAPLATGLTLRDLVSRLRAIPTAEMAAPDDALLEAMAYKLFADRGIEADRALVAYLLTRIERSAGALSRTVAALDSAALSLKRPVTRGLAIEFLTRPSADS